MYTLKPRYQTFLCLLSLCFYELSFFVFFFQLYIHIPKPHPYQATTVAAFVDVLRMNWREILKWVTPAFNSSRKAKEICHRAWVKRLWELLQWHGDYRPLHKAVLQSFRPGSHTYWLIWCAWKWANAQERQRKRQAAEPLSYLRQIRTQKCIIQIYFGMSWFNSFFSLLALGQYIGTKHLIFFFFFPSLGRQIEKLIPLPLGSQAH